MDSRSAAAETEHSYPPAGPWITSPTATAPANATSANSPPIVEPSAAPFPTHLDLLPLLLPQQSSLYQAQLLHYNKLVSPQRGGGSQTTLLNSPISAPHIQAAPRTRSRSSSKVSNKDYPTGRNNQGGHGRGSASHPDKGDRAVITGRDIAFKMAAKQGDVSHPLPARPGPPPHNQSHSSSVPSTPHQHARNFSFGSREPSPNATTNHSPRSAYSETSSALPSLRPLPPRLGGCQYETAMVNSRRRIPYHIGMGRLERADPATIKSKLSEAEERKLTTDMRELFNRLLPTPEVEKNRTRLVVKLGKILNDEWPGHGIQAHLFGSSGNMLCSDDSDVDVCITTPWKDLEGGVCMIAELLARRGMQKIVCISAAKVPIVKMYDPELKLACDMNVNNTLALENTRMIRMYVEIDPRVRPLAMIIKYWTRRRVINDAGLGGTLSSYTWICLIIAFLQLRDPPVLPALHQQLRHRKPRRDGDESQFSDDLSKVEGFGAKNKASLGQLLFQFFRFFAHEFDYDKQALSVRKGQLLTKAEKGWLKGTGNNNLCCEEPFTVTRNLGNTADDNAFRGLHLEIRRAFDLVSEAKLDECCEQFIFPKEEERERVFTKQAHRPAVLRSSSQTHNRGRGGFRGGRNNFHRNGSGNRRASASTAMPYDPNTVLMPPIAMTPQDLAWYANPQAPIQYPGDLMSTALAFQMQPDPNAFWKLQLYNQTQIFAQAAQAQAMAQARMQGSSTQSPASERSRTNSFDTPPLSAPLRPDVYNMYGFHAVPTFYSPPAMGTFPSSPASTSGAAPEGFRRSLQRSAVTSDTSGSSMRSQSQPASRSVPTSQPGSAQPANGMPVFPSRNRNGIPIPSFIPDDADYDEVPQRPVTDTPPSEDGSYMWHSAIETSSPGQRLASDPNGIAFGDIGQATQGRRRLSTDQQSLIDRRLRNASSRSPSPSPTQLGHARAFSVGTSSTPLPQAPFAPTSRALPSRPLVVNGTGSALKTSSTPGQRQTSASSVTDSLGSEDASTSGYENHQHPNFVQGLGLNYPMDPMAYPSGPASEPLPPSLPERPPVVVNGSGPWGVQHRAQDDASFRDRVSRMNQPAFSPPAMFQPETGGSIATAAPRSTPTAKQRLMSRQQQGVIAPLDLAIGDYRVGDHPLNTDLQHLSPVYETRTPSPTALRRFDGPPRSSAHTPLSKEARAESSKSGQKADEGRAAAQPGSRQSSSGSAKEPPSRSPTQAIPASQLMPPPPLPAHKVNGTKENGHPRAAAKSEGYAAAAAVAGEGGGWQKAGKHRKKGGEKPFQANGHVFAEPLPKFDADRKGG